jgi:hypothetical protein
MTVLKAITADLQTNVVSVYDQNKTTISGFIFPQVINGVPVLAPPLVKWMDIFTDSGEVVAFAGLTVNGRLFGMTLPGATGLAKIVYYDFDLLTGVSVYRGKIQVSLPNTAVTTHTVRGFRTDDTNPNDFKIFFTTTGSVAVNGGLFMVNKLTLSDFAPVSFPTIPFGIGSNQKSVYFFQDPSNAGSGQLNIASVGIAIDRTNQKVYVHNGVSATHQYYVYDYSVTPNVPQSTVTITIATPGVVTQTAHGYNTNDQIVLSTTGALPTGLVAGTTYFVKNPTANTFELSATSGGASLTTLGSQSGVHSSSRAFGISTLNFSFKTGNLPALTGTILSINSEKFITPGHSINAGSPCLFFATNSALYIGKVSDLSSGSTSWASLITANLLGSTNQVTTPVAVNAAYNEVLDRAVFTTSTTKIISKKIINNLYEDIFGVLNNDYLEGTLPASVVTQFGAISITEFSSSQGWTFLLGSTVGQRGMLALNTGASYRNGSTYIISKVLDTPNTLQYVGAALSAQLAGFSGPTRVSYRTSGFGLAAGGWILLPTNNLLNAISPAAQIQFKIEFNPCDSFLNNPTPIIEMYLALIESVSMSDNWTGSVANSSLPSVTPFYVAFRLDKAYTGGVVPRMFVRVVDDTGAISTYDTVTNASLFTYTTNNGTSWNALGTIPNVAKTTEVRLNIASPSGNAITCGILEY